MAAAVGSFTTQAFGGAYPYAPSLTHDATGATALLVFASSAGGYAWDPTATFAGAAMTLLGRSTSAGGQGTLWMFGLASPPQVSGTVALLRSTEYGDVGTVTAISLTGTADAPFEASAVIHGTTSVTASLASVGADTLLVGAAHDHYTSGAAMTTPAGATAIFSQRTNTNHQQFGYSRVQAAAGPASMTFATAFNAVGGGLVAIRPAPPRNAVKPIGTLTASATGQYSGLKALWAFNGATASTEPNLAQTNGALTIGANVANRKDAIGGYLDTFNGGTGRQGGKTTHTLAQMGIAAGQPFTVFLRLVPPQFNEGTDRTVFGFGGTGSYTFNAYGTIYEFQSGGEFYGFGERPGTGIETLVVTYDPATDTLTAYKNGVLANSHTDAGTSFAARTFVLGWDDDLDYYPIRERIYEAGLILGAWSAAQAAAYDAAPLAMFGTATPPPDPVDHSLTATPVTAGAPVTPRPVLTQGHAVAAPALAAAAPVTAKPALSQNHAPAASPLAAGSPAIAAASLSQGHSFQAAELEVAAPILGQPAASVETTLQGADLASGAPVLALAALSQAHQLAPTGLSSGAPVPNRPATAQNHALHAPELAAGPGSLAQPSVTQAHVLQAASLVSPAPVLSGASLGIAGELAPAALDARPPVLGRPAVAQGHALEASGLDAAPPALGAPALTVTVTLAPQALTGTAPVLGPAALTQAHRLNAQAMIHPAAVLARASASFGHTLAAAALVTGSPVLGLPALNGTLPTATPRGPALPALARAAAIAAAPRPLSPPAAPRTGP